MLNGLNLITIFFATVLSIAQAHAATPPGKRVALVIGNSAYQHSVPLPNPKNDAQLIGETLRLAGFSVISGFDLSKSAMLDIVDKFTEEAYDADTALVFYAGHGLQVNGQNYLVPVDANLEKAAQLQTRTIPIDKLLAALPPAPAVNIVVLDACRDNPLGRSLAASLPAGRSMGVSKGLASVQTNSVTGGGLLIAYATDPGAIAGDGTDNHSPYTAALARHLTTPGLEIQSALTRVRADVSEATRGNQNPWHNASLSREVFLGGEPTAKAASAVTADTMGLPTIPAADNTAIDWTIEQKLWDEASKRNTVAHYELYLAKYPNGNFSTLANLNLDQLKAQKTEVASVDPTPGEATAFASTSRTAVAMPEDIKLVPGTPDTETMINLDKAGRIDLQLRLGALGHVTGGADGALGAKSRMAIGAWQRQSGMIETTYLTPQQHLFLIVQTDPMMAQVRARYETDKAAAAKAALRRSQTTTDKATPTNQKPVRRTNNNREGTLEGPVESNNNDEMTPAGAAFTGALLGGALGGILSNR
ncbi:caspase domain-containing protein [Rhizobium sp. 32-5/1]|uniref:caspase family protein n=1 Tax=Rhizobium sp. 32-5/1 TaxID=3019602 RepID=UPI00240E24C2|nr:caspase domain-containing protein [Rhizobium sp. 32-5/1]WEZ82657.1 caspase domain-containing protein [Rhizobium sp. 32-5/1]